jgi:hypothetical protein
VSKKVISAKETREVALNTISEVASIVSQTAGPRGNPIIIQRDGTEFDGTPQAPHITKDGITVARSITYSDNLKETIRRSVEKASADTVQVAGDGPQPLTAKVLTPTGFVEMKDIQVGMKICGTDGSIQTVEGVFPKGKKQVAKVIFSDGREVECCLDHLWNVTKDSGAKKILTTKEILHDGLIRNKANGEKQYKYFTPRTPVEFYENKAEMPLDPYLVGVLLGDDKNYIRAKLHGVREKARSLGLCNRTSHTKFIPKSYLYASTKSREALLNGLIDTDGHINTRGLFEYSTVSNELAQDFLTLVRSLGIPVNYRLHSRENDPNSFSDVPIHRITQLKGHKYGDKIVDIKLTDEFQEMQCIKVSNRDHLYITDNFITTHNTTTTVILLDSIYKEGLKHVEQGNNGIKLYNELMDLAQQCVEHVDSIKKDVTVDSVRDVALILLYK